METEHLAIPVKNPRKFLPDDLEIDSWEKVEPYFVELQNRKINSVKELEQWMHDRSELDAVFSEDMAWRYINMTCDTANKDCSDSYNFFLTEIEPKAAPFNNEFDKKLVGSAYLKDLDPEKYKIYLRTVRNSIALFRENNIPLFTEIQTEARKYGEINGTMTVTIDGKEATMQKAASFLKSTDRTLREDVYNKIVERRGRDEKQLNDLFDHLIKLRHQVALNAGFKNFRDYKFASLGRFDYTVKDCYDFHESIKKEIVPIIEEFDRERKKHLGLEKLKPWDSEVDVSGKPPLKPFENGEELINKTIECFRKIRPAYGRYLEIMKSMGYLDLDSRIGKAPGGYNYPLYEIGVPFIFMNSVGTLRDLVTMVHEGGHAIHSFLTRDLEITDFKSAPSEVAELASMSMELISMENWEMFFSNKDELTRAKQEQLEKVLRALPWIAAVDKFQHWIYENPTHNVEERANEWVKIMNEFGSKEVDWNGYENTRARGWQSQLHIFEVPFYYIEYGMAQLGAIAVWRNYKNSPAEALDGYEKALKLGYTKSIGDIYSAAGIKFDFSGSYVKELADFVKVELKKI
jgi:oligoendopeptidase F